MHETHAIPNIIWIMLCWQVALLAIAFIVWAITRKGRDAQRHEDAPQTPAHTPAAPVVEQDAPGMRSIATFQAHLYEQELDAEVWDHDAMVDELMERIGGILMAEGLDVEESYADEDLAELSLSFVYRDALYHIALSVEEGDGQLWLNQVHADSYAHHAPSDSFATRELLMELQRFLRQAPVCEVRWHARQNVHVGNMDAWANTPF